MTNPPRPLPPAHGSGLTDAEANRTIAKWMGEECVYKRQNTGLWGVSYLCQHDDITWEEPPEGHQCRKQPAAYCTDWNATMRALGKAAKHAHLWWQYDFNIYQGVGDFADGSDLTRWWMTQPSQRHAHALADAIKAQDQETQAKEQGA